MEVNTVTTRLQVKSHKGSGKVGEVKMGMKNGWVTQCFSGIGSMRTMGLLWTCSFPWQGVLLHWYKTAWGKSVLWCKQSNLMTVILSLANLKLFLICPEILIKTTQQGLRFFFFPAGKISFLSVQIERMIFLSVSKLASLGPCSEMVMSTLQNRDKSHLAKTEKERKMVVNGISLLKKKKK